MRTQIQNATPSPPPYKKSSSPLSVSNASTTPPNSLQTSTPSAQNPTPRILPAAQLHPPPRQLQQVKQKMALQQAAISQIGISLSTPRRVSVVGRMCRHAIIQTMESSEAGLRMAIRLCRRRISAVVRIRITILDRRRREWTFSG